MKVAYTQKFVSLYENLPENIKRKAEKQEKLFKANIFYPSLNTEKLMQSEIIFGVSEWIIPTASFFILKED